VPGYEILAELGRGGMGVVYKARQTRLNRLVALKMILSGAQAGADDLARFRTEAEAIARLQHPNIVQIHEVGEHEGKPFFSLEFCPGGSLDRRLAGTPLKPKAAARLIQTLARAMQAAHDKGVIHRDLKPANVLLAEDDTPKITDFGLAKKLDEEGKTATGAVMGTPSYMAPEQAGSAKGQVGPAADVYALGAILYECLTGRPPFKAATPLDTIMQVVGNEPVAPARLNAGVPRDLETICLKCLRKEPGQRYASAAALAEDLRRFRAGEAIAARPAGGGERLMKWVRRRPAAAALIAVSGLALIAVVALVVGLAYSARLVTAYQAEEAQRQKAEQARDEADAARQGEEEQRKKAQAALALADRIGYLHSIFLADLALRENNVLVARNRLEECQAELRGWEWRYLNSQSYPELASFHGSLAAFSPDGAHIAVAGDEFLGDGLVRLYEVRTGREIATLRAQGRMGNPVRLLVPVFSRDGTRLAAWGKDGLVRIYDARTGREAFALGAPVQFFLWGSAPVFSPDGTRIAVRGEGKFVRLYDTGTGQEALTLKGSVGDGAPAFSPDGGRIAAAATGAVRVYDARTGREVVALTPPDRLAAPEFGAPVFSADGTRLIAADHGDLRAYDAHTGQERFAVKGGAGALSPDGEHVATVDRDGVVRVKDLPAGQESPALRGPVKLDMAVFSPDGARVAARGEDGVVRVFDARTGQEAFRVIAPVRLGMPVFNPDGTLLAVGGASRFDAKDAGGAVVRLYDARAGQEALALRRPASRTGLTLPTPPKFAPDGGRIAVPAVPFGGDGVARVFDLRTGQEAPALQAPTPLLLAFSPDGARVAAACEDGAVRLLDARTGQQVLTVKGAAKLTIAAFSPDGRRIAALDEKSAVQVYDAQTGQPAQSLQAPVPLSVPVFSPDGTRIAVGSPLPLGPGLGSARDRLPDGAVRVYDAHTGREAFPALPAGLTGPVLPVFSPDGKYLAASGREGMQVYDARTGQQVQALKAAPGAVPVFSPDGTRLATQGADSLPKLFDVQTGQEALGPIKRPAGLFITAFSPDGTRLVTECDDGAVRLHDARTGQEVMSLRAAAKLGGAVFSSDGTRLAAVGNDGVVRVWAAPNDPDAWRGERRQALLDGAAAWHRAQADEFAQAGQWFAATFHLDRLIAAEPANGKHYLERGQALVALRKTDAAHRDFARALALRESLSLLQQAAAHAELDHWDEVRQLYARAVGAPDASPQDLSEQAVQRLQRGDHTNYRAACAALMSRFGNSNDAAVARQVAWTCAVGPAGLPDPKPAVELARRAVRTRPRDGRARGTLGAVLFRAGQHKEAASELHEAIKLKSEEETAFSGLFLAMSHHRLGEPNEARRWLDGAGEAGEKLVRLSALRRLELQLLRRETEALLKEAPAPMK
jgi:WD40 repeat protein/Flp pilus assembly protein TadD/tRNA A-37 threonylcarbamoyl transferase component Bud32